MNVVEWKLKTGATSNMIVCCGFVTKVTNNDLKSIPQYLAENLLHWSGFEKPYKVLKTLSLWFINIFRQKSAQVCLLL